jgi:hypothetical protein
VDFLAKPTALIAEVFEVLLLMMMTGNWLEH